ncbi:MAG: TonB-dependent receptor, partial [Acidobacteriota bacterium]|nr:TonB-dependent receptor [Acidobacteriota bacterium]
LVQPLPMRSQTAGEGTIAGTVTDTTGAVVANATVTAINGATNVSTQRTTSSAGSYTISPLLPGTYSVTISVQGFKTFRQDNLVVNALGSATLNAVLILGSATETVTVTSAPPLLDTDNATLGTVVENKTYSNLPILMSTITFAQRDPTAFASLTPGTQASTSSLRPAIVGGMGNNLQQLYLDGIPAETVNQQGDTRLVGLNVDVDAVDQFQVLTSIPPVEYSGAGALNFTMKSGGLKYHGQASDFVRNTIFDAWSFTNKWVPALGSSVAQCIASANRSLCQPKPYEHQNELSVSVGGKVPFTHDKLFFFVAYDKYKGNGPGPGSPAFITVPTLLMRSGDFTELNGNIGNGGQVGVAGNPAGTGNVNPAIIYDPLTNTCVGTVCSRTPFQGLKNGVPTYNIIPSADISPISQKLQSFLPAPSNPNAISSNYIGTRVSGNDNHLTDYRVDYDLSSKQRLSTLGAIGVNHFLNNFGAPFLPLPYVGGDLASVYPKQFVVEDTFTFSPRIVNQFKYGYTRFFMDIRDATDGIAAYGAPAMGITNLPSPAGQASSDFPNVTFSANPTGISSTAIQNWKSGAAAASTITTPSTFALVDNVQWQKGKHALTFGGSLLFLEVHNTGTRGPTGLLTLPYNAVTTANYVANSGTLATTNTATQGAGYSYASFLIGAVGGSPSIGLNPLVQQIDSRYRTFAPYAADTWKVTNKLTVDLGLRWDYLQPYHELKNHFTFMNPALTNPSTGTLGALQFAGNGVAPAFCNCRTPVQTDWKNFGPRVGVIYAVDEKTVIRAGFALVYSFGGGTGGGRTNGGGGLGAGQSLGYTTVASATTPEVTTGAGAAPAFWLNTQAGYLGAAASSALGLTYPATPTDAQLASEGGLNAGNYLANGKVVTAASLAYEDPITSGVPPEFTLYNFGFQRSVTRDLTLMVNYAGNQAHHVFEVGAGGNPRGYWTNQLNPAYLPALGGVLDSANAKPILTAPATSANVAKARTASGLALPMPGGDSGFFVTAANAFPSNASLTLAQALVAFPQYSGVSDGWGSNVQNFSYNSLQITLSQRSSHGLTFNINYTYSKNIGDDGSFRSGYDLPAAALDGGTHDWKQNRIDRSWTTISQPEVLNMYGVYEMPFGKRGHMGGESLLIRSLLGGWVVSSIYQYASGAPIAVVSSSCTGQAANAGQCMPSLTPGASNARAGGSYGTGPNGTVFSNLGAGGIKYLDSTAFIQPQDLSAAPNVAHQYKIGNAPRTAPFQLRNPGLQNVNAAIKRSFPIHEGIALTIEADCSNVWNKVQFSGPNASWSTTASAPNNAFGQISGIANLPRSWQFAGHFTF